MKIRSDILRTYQSVHTWTGIVAGLVLFIGFYAGSLSMFEDEISYWATPPVHHLSPIQVDQYDELIAKALATSPKVEQQFKINFSHDLSPMTWYEKGGGRGLTLNDVLMHATLSPQGELVTQAESSNELGNLIDMLHRTAGIVGKVGHEDLGVLVLGVACVLYFLALVSGIIFLLPTLVKSFFALRKDKGANRLWLDTHNLVGLISLPFHFIIAWSVIVFAFHDVLYDGLSLVYGDQPMFNRGADSAVEYKIEQLPSVQSYLNKIEQLADGYRVESIEYSGLTSSRPSLGVTLMNEHTMMRNNSGDYIYMNPYTFEVRASSLAMNDEQYYVPYVASFFSLHFGGIGGDLGRWVYFIMGLLGAFLFYSGNLLWLEKRRQKKGEQTKANKFMANLTVGVCFGSILGVVVAMLSSKWLYLMNISINESYLACYYIIFFASLIYSFVRGAAKSAIDLQKALGVACLCIPVTSLLLLAIPNEQGWAYSHFSNFSLDIVAFIFAMIFLYGAVKTKHRAYFGQRNSIWAL